MSAEVSLPSPAHSNHRQYARAPIVEAVLQLSFAGADNLIDATRDAVEALSSHYPERKKLFGISSHLKPTAQGLEVVSSKSGSAGTQLEEIGGHRVVRISDTAISAHELRPYGGWEGFRSHARDVIATYLALMPPRIIQRIGVRYINRLELPVDCGDLQEWITSAPDIPDGLPPYVSSYSLEMAMPQPDGPSVVAIMRQALLKMEQPTVVPVILDIELVSNASVDSSSVWDVIEFLHQREHNIFEHTITDRVRNLIA